MRCRTRSSRALALALLASAAPAVIAGELSGDLTVEATQFTHAPLDPRQSDAAWSIAFEPEWYHDWNDGADRVQVTLFGRWDSVDDARSHYDLRELYWRRSFESTELRVGLRKVFWGVTESQHLVDVINQTDGVENLDGEDKLGQPMINFAWIGAGWAGGGTVDLFVMPLFRERTFAGAAGRPRFAPRVADELALWESSDEERHVDYAARWQHTLGSVDLGLSWFAGTARDPLFQLALTPVGEPVLTPIYLQARQWSLDLQSTRDAWLWKLEWLTRDWQPGRYSAAAFGFERTVYGIFASGGGGKDLGLIAEYLFDDRPALQRTTPYEDDLFIGARLVWNDAQSTELLAGTIIDLSGDGMFLNVEWSRRLGSSFKLALEARALLDVAPVELFYPLRDDDYLRIELGWYF
jgi:hypothetical protein